MLKKIEENLIDKAIAYVAPNLALERRRARYALALTGSYTGARKDRRQTSEWSLTGGSADSDIIPDLPTLRERSRDLIRNQPLAAGAIHTKVTNVVGGGLQLQSRVNRDVLGLKTEEAESLQKLIESEFSIWAKSYDCEIERTLNFYAQQELVFRSCLENGDVFVLLTYRERLNRKYSLCLQNIEADRVCNAKNAPDSNTLVGGVEKDEDGAPVKYHILKNHPGSNFSTPTEWSLIPAYGSKTGRRNILHLYRKLRVGQTRGVPDLAPVIEPFKQLAQYSEAELSAAVVSAMFTVFIKSEDGLGLNEVASNTNTSSKPNDFKLGPAAMLDLNPGESVELANPNRPNQAFDGFVMAVLRQIGVALELPFEILIKHFESSYSAARAAMLEAWRFFYQRRKWLADNYCQPVFEAWFTEAVATGVINAPGFFEYEEIRAAYVGSEWIGPARGQIDEYKEIQAAEKRIALGITTRVEETAQMTGGDWELKNAQRAREQQLIKTAGIVDAMLNENNSNKDNLDEKMVRHQSQG